MYDSFKPFAYKFPLLFYFDMLRAVFFFFYFKAGDESETSLPASLLYIHLGLFRYHPSKCKNKETKMMCGHGQKPIELQNGRIEY